jgi:hypothetical protein
MVGVPVRRSKGKGEGGSGRGGRPMCGVAEGRGGWSRWRPRPGRGRRGLCTARAGEGWGADKRAWATVPRFKLIQTGQIYFKMNSNVYE